jgi:hypothetical protein
MKIDTTHPVRSKGFATTERRRLFARRLGTLLTGLAASGLAGCGASLPGDADVAKAGPPMSAQWRDQRLHVDVPVQVITIGIPAATVSELAANLQPLRLNQAVIDSTQSLPPNLEQIGRNPDTLVPSAGEYFRNPTLPTAQYQVRALPDRFETEFRAALEAARLGANLFDANRIEDWLAQALSRHGVKLDEDAPAVVLMHLGGLGVSGHGWQVDGHRRSQAPVRVFGERHPLLVLDASADADPWAGSQNAYDEPVTSTAAAPMADFIRDATWFRLLHGPIYPVPTARCHAVTVLAARHTTNLAENDLLLPRIQEAFSPQRFQQALENLSGADVRVDVKFLSLPTDDPALDAVSRPHYDLYDAGAQPLMGYVDLAWEQYHVDHPGCEEYVFLQLISDAADPSLATQHAGLASTGVAFYDHDPQRPGRRFAFGWLTDALRLSVECASPLVVTDRCATTGFLESWLSWLAIHEVGHLFGQAHPHNAWEVNESPALLRDGHSMQADPVYANGRTNWSFGSTLTAMSYIQAFTDFGAVERNNWERNRAGWALLQASADGREGSKEWNKAMKAAGQLDWQGVWEALQE